MSSVQPCERRRRLAAVLLLAAAAGPLSAEDWPTGGHDARRSGRTAERIPVDALESAWTWRSAGLPRPAWDGPARWDAYAGIRGLRHMRLYDPVFHVAAAGDAVYLGSSADDSVRCLDARTGAERWRFTADGPVRVAPTCSEGKVYFGSDDGRAYCLDAATGAIVWTHDPAPDGLRIVNDGRLIPFSPCRTGVLVEGGTAYFGCSLLPWKDAYLCAVDAASGRVSGPGRFVARLEGTTLEGPLLVAGSRIVAPQGRVAPLLFRRDDGAVLGSLDGGGGSFVVLTEDDQVFHGPGNKTGWITGSDAATRTKIASFAGGSAIVVAGPTAYLLTDDSLVAIDRAAKTRMWTVPCDCPYSLVLAGDILFAGGDDTVAAFSSRDGYLLWRRGVEGRAYGLAVANGALLASTDEGRVHCFRAGAPRPESPPAAEGGMQGNAGPIPAAVPLEPAAPFADPDLLGRWVFQAPHVEGRTVRDLAGGRDARIEGPLRLERIGGREVLVLDGARTSAIVADDSRSAPLPRREMSVEAWVRVDRPERWGGIAGAVQDNGAFERGWILGTAESRFSFALASREGPGRLTYLAARSEFRRRSWHHVLGTYDGATMRIWIDGRLEGESSEQKGEISYPERAVYEIGAYHDDDEYYRLQGRIHEVRVLRRALGEAEARERAAAWSPPVEDLVELPLGPWIRFTGPESAEFRWRTPAPTPSILEISLDGEMRTVDDPAPKLDHLLRVDGLRRDRSYACAVRTGIDGRPGVTEEFECDGHSNYAVPPVPDRPDPWPPEGAAEAAATAGRIIERSGVRRGIAVLLGSGDGRLALEILRRSELRIIGIETDRTAVDSSRRALIAAGAYGTRVAVHRVESLGRLLSVGGFANLVVAPRIPAGEPGEAARAEARRILRPGGGVAILDGPEGEMVVRGPADGSGEWTHLYGRPDNSAFGGEALGGAASVDDLEVQWVGRPGPRFQADRNGRKPSPLAAGGRLYHQGLRRMIAVDAWNGTILWSLEIPGLERFNMPRDSSNWCADEDHLFAAVRDRLWQIDGASGEIAAFHEADPGPREGGTGPTLDWGYVARLGGLILGTAVRRGTAYTEFWGDANAGWYDAVSGPVTAKVAGESLFAIEKGTGRLAWAYRGGPILHATIVASAGRVHFVECRSPKVLAAVVRRLGPADLEKDLFLVALDAATGGKVWERPIEAPPCEVALSLATDGRILVLAGSGGGTYGLRAFGAYGGEPRWEASRRWSGDNHGAHMSRPAIAGGAVYLRPSVLDLATGEPLGIEMPLGGCGTYAASEGALVFRAGNVTLWDRRSCRTTSWARLRPDCWLSTIPACGLLLSPEGGGGCSCGSWMETSIAFAPRRP